MNPNIKIPRIYAGSMRSPQSGLSVANQFEVETRDGRYFISYASIVAFAPRKLKSMTDPMVLLTGSWNCSRTTSKYLAQFLGHDTKETKKRLQRGEYAIAELGDMEEAT
jgi:hypothetical protein